jgi:uncharacterized protein
MVFLIYPLGLFVLIMSLSSCNQWFFYPQRQILLTPAALELEFEDVYFTSVDGLLLHGWFLPATQKAFGTILFLHGNAENISTHLGSVYWLPESRFNVFLLDYRGFGRSEGTPTIGGIHKDAESALQYLASREDINSEGLIVFGQSLGGTLAVHTVAHTAFRRPISAVVIESAFASYPGIAQEKLAEFWLTWPLHWLPALTVENAYEPLDAIAQVSPIPLLIIHGDDDVIVPAHHAYRLYEKARPPKKLWVVKESGHIGTFRQLHYRERFVAYLKRLLTLCKASGGEKC